MPANSVRPKKRPARTSTTAASVPITVAAVADSAAMRMLEHEGFRYEQYCDIFDGGPTMTAPTDQVRTIRDAVVAPVTAIVEDGGEEALIAAGRLADFRCVFGHATAGDAGITLTAATARDLRVAVGDEVALAGRG